LTKQTLIEIHSFQDVNSKVSTLEA